MDVGGAPASPTPSALPMGHPPPGTPSLTRAHLCLWSLALVISLCEVVAKEGLFGDGELGIHHPQLDPSCYHSLCMFMASQLRAYGAAAWKPVTSTAALYSPLICMA